jgi:hypothetical protein
MSAYHYYQVTGGEEDWKAVPATHLYHLLSETRPMFVTVLAVSKLVEDLSYEDKMKLAYEGPLYFDFDSTDESIVIEKVKQFLDKLETLKVNLNMCRLYATGGRGYHIEIPQTVFVAKIPKGGIANLPSVYREMALDLCVDTLDLRVYSGGRGRMWRQPGVQRENGRYKVPITASEMRIMTPELCQQLTSIPRSPVNVAAASFCPDLSILFDRCAQKVEDLFKKRMKFKPDPAAKEKAFCDSVQWMMAGYGIKPTAGFQEIATQIAIAGSTAGLSEEELVQACKDLIATHKGNGNRYDTPGKREEEIRRMYRYMYGNLCYEFSVGAIKSLLTHPAPDLDGIQTTKEEVLEVIKEAEAQEKGAIDEYGDVARGITLSKFGVYADVEGSKKRICAMSFSKSSILKSLESGQISGYETDIMINGRFAGRQTLELEVFSGLVPFNRFSARYGHAFQGTDAQVRILMMRFVEDAKKNGEEKYILNREGLDVIHIPHHENPVYRDEFLVWADSQGVVLPPHISKEGLNLTFAGYPDPRGYYKTDLRDAPDLVPWLKEDDNKTLLKEVLKNLFTCQRAELLGKLVGWYTACYWRQIFHKAYGKFPLMHVNGSAGAGKCLAKDTPVIMVDGSVKPVQDILVGDQLLGPDGKPRNVLSLARGEEMMYEVRPVDVMNSGLSRGARPYVVNESHILSLRESTVGRAIVNVSIRDYLTKASHWKTIHYGWRVPGVLKGNLSPELHSITVEPVGEGDYYGFTIDGDHLFMLGDFTVTHNTDMCMTLAGLFYYKQEVKSLTPGSTTFSMTQMLTASASIPMILDEYKPHEMDRATHNKLKAIMRDAYNQKEISRGGGTREAQDFRILQTSQLSAPIAFIAEATEEEAAVMERVVLATVVRPPPNENAKWLARFQLVRKHRQVLGILGKYIASMIVTKESVESLRREFDFMYDEAQEKFMVSESDLKGGITEDALREKQQAKERSVFNHTVAKFGMRRFRQLVESAIGPGLNPEMEALENGIYDRMKDLQSATTPEYVKVLIELASMSYHVDDTSAQAIRKGKEYAYTEVGGVSCLEVAVRPSYFKYRAQCSIGKSFPLFANYDPFAYALKDSPAFLKFGIGASLQVPNVFVFKLDDLNRLGVPNFKP